VAFIFAEIVGVCTGDFGWWHGNYHVEIFGLYVLKY